MKLYIWGLLLLILVSGCIKISTSPTGAVVIEDLPEEKAIEQTSQQETAPETATETEEEVETQAEEQEETAENETTEEQSPNTVIIKDLEIDPKELTIKVGETVVWNHRDRFSDRSDIRHLIKAHYNEFRSSTLYYGDSFNHTFTEPGEYSYIDVIYTGKNSLRGTIIVE